MSKRAAQILGLVGSARRWGNSELMVRQILRGAQQEGASTWMIRPTDLSLESCTGCMRCVIGSGSCRIEDDMEWLVSTIEGADGLVLAAPTYFLGPAAVIKLILDRLLMVTGQVQDDLPEPRPAVTVVTAGLENWRGVTAPYLNALVAAFGFLPIECLSGIAPDPGEVLLDEGLMARALAAGQRLGRGELDRAPVAKNVCPVCRCDSFTMKGNRAMCPICTSEAVLQFEGRDITLAFEPGSGSGHRWTPETLREHMVDWVMATGPRFMERRAEIKERRRPFRRMEASWLGPPSDGTPAK
jgi:multimeric flavodoxin WrbA